MMKAFSVFVIGFSTLLLGSVVFAEEPSLKDITLYATGGAYLTPAFTPVQQDYTVTVNSDIAEAQIVALAAADNTFTINDQAVASGAAYTAKLEVGGNVYALQVTAPDGAAKTYTITITKEDIKPVADKFLKLTYTDAETGQTMPYRLFVPEKYDAQQTYPLVLFLHGGGERGDDNEKQILANQGATIWAKPDEQAKRPCFVLAPQAHNAPDGGFGITRDAENKLSLKRVFEFSPDLKLAVKTLEKVLAEYSIDNTRIYATGLSQGGFGVWNLGATYPDVFAAIVPICGGVDPALAGKLASKPIWAFHAAEDPIIPVSYSRNSISAIRNVGGNPRYTEYASGTYLKPMEHFSWALAYQTVEMREWLFSQKKP